MLHKVTTFFLCFSVCMWESSNSCKIASWSCNLWIAACEGTEKSFKWPIMYSSLRSDLTCHSPLHVCKPTSDCHFTDVQIQMTFQNFVELRFSKVSKLHSLKKKKAIALKIWTKEDHYQSVDFVCVSVTRIADAVDWLLMPAKNKEAHDCCCFGMKWLDT